MCRWTLRGALRLPLLPRVTPSMLDMERAAHTHLIYSKVPGIRFLKSPLYIVTLLLSKYTEALTVEFVCDQGMSFQLAAADTWREAVEFSPVSLSPPHPPLPSLPPSLTHSPTLPRPLSSPRSLPCTPASYVVLSDCPRSLSKENTFYI